MDLLPAKQAVAIPALRTVLQRRPSAARAGHTPWAPLNIRATRFPLSAPIERTVAAAWRRKILIAGGLDASGQSVAGVFSFDPSTGALHSIGALPQPVHDAAGAMIGGRLYVFGGGAASSSDAVQTFDPAGRRGSIAARLPRPLSDVVSAQINGVTYLVGGFDGNVPRTEILATGDGRHFTLAGRLPVGLRYPAVVADGGKLLVAGGQAAGGLSSAVYAFDTAAGTTALLARLPAPVAAAAAVVRGNTLYVIGGSDAAGTPTGAISAVDLTRHRAAATTRTIAARANAAGAQLGASTFLIGGRGTRALASVLAIGDAG
jgi:hypothetical protein